jgi:hypothetical protein
MNDSATQAFTEWRRARRWKLAAITLAAVNATLIAAGAYAAVLLSTHLHDQAAAVDELARKVQRDSAAAAAELAEHTRDLRSLTAQLNQPPAEPPPADLERKIAHLEDALRDTQAGVAALKADARPDSPAAAEISDLRTAVARVRNDLAELAAATKAAHLDPKALAVVISGAVRTAIDEERSATDAKLDELRRRADNLQRQIALAAAAIDVLNKRR